MKKIMTRNMGRAGIVSVVALSLLLASGGFGVTPAQAAADTALYFNPASASVTEGDDFNLVATIDPGANAVSAVELHVTFDQTKLRLDSITASSTFSLELAAAVMNNTNGTASIALGVPLANPSVTTVQPVATFAFHALATATDSPVDFTTASMAAADGESGDAIATQTGATVTIAASGSPDTTPPTRSAGSPSGTLAAGTTQATVSLSTNEAATCKYGTSAGVAYASIANTFTTTGNTSHSFTATGLADSGSYAYYVRCVDGSDNANTTDYAISFSVAAAGSTVVNDDDDDDDDNDKVEVKPRKITDSKKNVKRGQVLTQRGKKFSKKSMVALYFSKANGAYYPPMMVKTTSTGSFMVKYRVNKPAGKYSWYAVDTKTGKKSKVITYTVK